MNPQLLLLLLPLLTSSPSRAQAPVLDCARCGIWTIVASSFPGLVGDKFIIDRDRITLPPCGAVAYRGSESASGVDRDKAYLSDLTFALNPDSTCMVFGAEQPLAAKFSVSYGFSVEASFGTLTVVSQNTGKVFAEYSAWNLDREDPCEAGSSGGFSDCYAQSTASVYSQLALNARELSRTPTGRKVRTFSLEKFSASVTSHCEHKEREAFTGLSVTRCENALFWSKLVEFQLWSVCRLDPHQKCTPPNEAIDTTVEY